MSPTDFENSDFKREIQKNLSDFSFDNLTRILYSTDASIYQIMPIGVVFPRNDDEIKAIVEICRNHQIPMLSRGSGTSLAGQAVSEALILDFRKYFIDIVEINADEKYVVAQSGVILSGLNKKVDKYGLMYGPDPASAKRATIGGIIGNNSTGAHFIEYGMTSDNVLGIDLILDDGQEITVGGSNVSKILTKREEDINKRVNQLILKNENEINKRYPKILRNASGYGLNLVGSGKNPDLSKLIIGSEGTLGIVSKAKLQLVERPEHKWLVIIQFDELKQALTAVPKLLECKPSAIELMDSILINLCKENSEYKSMGGFVEGNPDALLLVELTGNFLKEVESKLTSLKRKLSQFSSDSELNLIDQISVQEKIWNIRSKGLGILMSKPGDAKPIPFIEDISVPVENLADYVQDIKDACTGNGIDQVAIYAHASSGCLHVRPNIDLKSKSGRNQMRDIAEAAFEIVSKYGGANSGEHGDGLVRSEFLKKMYGKKIVGAFREIKQIFDPENLLNPGKIVDSPKMDDGSILRFRDGYKASTKDLKIIQDFSPNKGYLEAVEMCTGSGECLHLYGGVMCPSYQITTDEINSTRGRANALRAFLTGYFENNQLNPDQIFQVLDLCLSCQACKVECPSSVDMAKIKAEFLHFYYQKNRPSLRTAIFANIDRVSFLAQKLSGISNWLLVRFSGIINRIIRVSKSRRMPHFIPEKFSSWYKNSIRQSKSNNKQVVFFADTFTEYHKTNVGKLAIQVLEHLGYSTILVEKQVCCGRSAYSKGFLDRAKNLAIENIKVLAPYAKKGIPIVGVEPSCLSMFLNEYLALVPGEETEMVASQVKMIEEFLYDEIISNQLQINFDGIKRNVIYHGHCQQKANFGTEKVIEFLELIPNITVEMAETGCCGMAGSFGYEEEHFDISVEIGNKSLASIIGVKEQIICSSGTSCRDQIDHLSERESKHPIEIFAEALDISTK